MLIDQKILFASVLVIILIYCYYLNLQPKAEKLQEGFDTELGDVIDTAANPHKIKKLIETEDVKNFGVRLWDNHSRLKGLYPTGTPQTREECSNKNKGDGVDCPLGIWRPTPSTGYTSLGDVVTTTFMSPGSEKVIDARVAKSPGDIYHKNIETMAAAGAVLKEPADYIYVGGFGTGKMLDRLEKNEEYYRLMKQLKFYGEKLVKAVNEKQTAFKGQIKKAQSNLNDDFGIQVKQLKKSSSIKPQNGSAQSRLKSAIGSETYPNRDGLEFLMNQSAPGGNIFSYDVEYATQNMKNPYDIEPLINGLPPSVANELKKSLGENRGWGTQQVSVYAYGLWNLKIIDDLLIRRNGEHDVVYKNLNHFTRKANAFGNQPNSRCYDSSNTRHSLFITKPGVQMEIMHDITRGNGTKVYNNSTTFGKKDQIDQTCLNYHKVHNNDAETNHLRSIKMSIHRGLLESLYSNFENDETLKKLYNGFKAGIDMIRKLYPDLSNTGYRQLSIWQPVPPEGYLALGFVFTNDRKDKKPGKQTVACVPKNCVKNFKRRPWDPKLDLVFRYTGDGQQLAFYRNPYLNTVVVMDEKKENGLFKNKTPELLKYQSRKDSLRWECFDIVPCIEECDYVKRLEDADGKARGMCKAYRGLEGQHFEKQEYRKSVLDEEKKLRGLVQTRQSHIVSLMEKLNKMMSEEELYKLINKGMNRYTLKVDLQNQRKLHGDVADKLMKTRGIEINWNAPEELKKFKELLKRYIIARYTVKGPKRDCPVCKLPEDQGFVKMENLEMCYGCLEDVVRELINKKKAEGKVPAELKQLQDKINKKSSKSPTPTKSS